MLDGVLMKPSMCLPGEAIFLYPLSAGAWDACGLCKASHQSSRFNHAGRHGHTTRGTVCVSVYVVLP